MDYTSPALTGDRTDGGTDPAGFQGATMSIGAWLQQHGLGQYEALFVENAIDTDVLPEITESDLA